MKGDYGTLVWVKDDKGHELVCTIDRDFNKKR